MTDIKETKLPGVGVRHDFVTQGGDRLGMITHRTGRRELLVYDRDDPDACEMVIRLDDDDSRALAELLGGTQITRSLSDLQQTVDGLTIDWLPIRDDWPCAGKPIDQTGLQQKTGITIVAVVRGGETIASPGNDFRLLGGDTAVAVGTPASIRSAFALLQGD